MTQGGVSTTAGAGVGGAWEVGEARFRVKKLYEAEGGDGWVGVSGENLDFSTTDGPGGVRKRRDRLRRRPIDLFLEGGCWLSMSIEV